MKYGDGDHKRHMVSPLIWVPPGIHRQKKTQNAQNWMSDFDLYTQFFNFFNQIVLPRTLAQGPASLSGEAWLPFPDNHNHHL